MIAAPLFHAWGFAHFTLAMGLCTTVVLKRKFDPEATLSLTAQHECTGLVVVPVMLQRILELDDDVLRRYDLSALRAVPVSGSALPASVSDRWMDLFGENLFNLYGSTEVAWATIATPADLRAAPGTAGRPPRGTVVRLYDEDGLPVAPGDTGRIFVGNELAFEGYTGGGGKDVIEGLLSSGDVGHFDEGGRLFIDGRDDDMIVSGGENVFPAEVEELLSGHEAIAEAAVFGVEDEQFGQRLDGGRGRARRGPAERGRRQALRQVQPRRLQGPAGRPLRRRAPAHVDRQGAQARAQGGLSRGSLSILEAMPQRTDVFELERLGLTSGEGRRLDLHVHVEPFAFGGQQYAAQPDVVPVRLDVSRTTGAGWALRVRFEVTSRGLRPLPRAGRAALRRRRPRGRTSRARATTSCDRPTWTTRASSTWRPGPATRWRSPCPAQITCRPECAGLCAQCGANLNDEPDHAHETGPDPRWAKLSELKFD